MAPAKSYPGRGLVIGLTPDRVTFVQVYWIGGRSSGSQNRRFVSDASGLVRTEPIDLAKVKNSELIIYNAMAEYYPPKSRIFIVSNGNQTDSIAAGILQDQSLATALNGRIYEPDKSNYTCRITGVVRFTDSEKYLVELSLLRKSRFNASCERTNFVYEELPPGLGYCLTTYLSDGDPLPPFTGEPKLMGIESNDIDDIARAYWGLLNGNTRVALAVKVINLESRASTIKIINRF